MKIILRLLQIVLKYWRGVAWAVVFGWATVTSWIALMSTSAYLISAAALHPSVAELQVAIVGVRFFGISRGLFRYLERFLSHTMTFKLLADLRSILYQSVEPLAPAGLWEYQSGDLLGRIVDDIESLQEFYVRVVAPPVVALLSTTGVLIFFGRWGWDVSLALLGFQLFCGVIVPLLTRWLAAKPGEEVVTHRAALRSTVGESLEGIDEVTSLNQQQNYEKRFSHDSQTLGRAQRRLYWIEGLHGGLISMGVNFGMLAILILAVPKVTAGMIDGRLLAVLTLGALASFEAILPLPMALQHLGGSLRAGDRLFELMDQAPEVAPGGEDIELDHANFQLEIKDLSFAYSHNGNNILDQINLNLFAGKKVAIVGPSGSGKTTILKLLLRYWDYSRGEIMLNGSELRTFDPDQVRACFSVLSQETYLFNAPIDQNLRLAKPAASASEINSAVESANLTEFCAQLPDGFQTWVGEFGAKVSGGERQRLAIARALLKDAPILLLDEPTANLDPITERLVIKSILNHNPNQAVLLITHRMVAMDEMDEILVLAQGKIEERGTHSQLVELKGLYARMWQLTNDYLFD